MISKIKIRLDDIIGTINPNILGSQIEKGLLGSVEGGVWVGKDSKIPNINGIRKDIIEALRMIQLPLIRMGGCFAELYHWEDGVGSIGQRPRRINFWLGDKEMGQQEETNEFGTDEFIRFCHLVGAEPYLCINLSTGTPKEAFSWVEYCNYNGNTYYSQLRSKYGNQIPHNVKYWEIGNENWSCGGLMEPKQYARDYRKIAYNIRKFSSIPIELIACGGGRNWSSVFLQELTKYRHTPHDWPYFIDALVVHAGVGMGDTGSDVDFSDQQYYNIFGQVQNIENEIVRTIDLLNYFAGDIKDIKININEWTVNHSPSPPSQKNTLRTALAAACILNLFNRYSNKITQASAQLTNFAMCLICTEKERMYLTPYYHVCDMYKMHMGNKALRVHVESPNFNSFVNNRLQKIPFLDVSTSIKDNSKLVITIINRHLTEDLQVEIILDGKFKVEKGMARELISHDVHDYNTFDHQNRICPSVWKEIKTEVKDLTYPIKKHSLNEIVLDLK